MKPFGKSPKGDSQKCGGLGSNVIPIDPLLRASKRAKPALPGSDLASSDSGSSVERRIQREGEWVFLFPSQVAVDGGYLAQHRFARILSSLSHYDAGCSSVSIAEYDIRNTLGFAKVYAAAPMLESANHSAEPGLSTADIDELLATPASEDRRVYCIHYGPHINQLLNRLNGRRIVYFAHSTGWDISLPSWVPIVSVSKHCMGFWAKRAPSNPQFYLPNLIDERYCLPARDGRKNRTVDVLVIKRKMSSYLIDELVPALKPSVNVQVIDRWDSGIESAMQNAKVFLYDSSQYWKTHGATEGFGLPPLEALACGCEVFSSLNDGLSDFLEPGINCQQLHNGSVSRDKAAIVQAVKDWQPLMSEPPVVAGYRWNAVRKRLRLIIKAIA